MVMTQKNSVLFSCVVEKICTGGSTLSRSIFITPTSLLVCLLSGGVTQTISLSSVVTIQVAQQVFADGRPRCVIHVRNAASSTFSFMSQEDIDCFVDVVSQAAGGLQIAHLEEKAVSENKVGLNISRSTPKSVHFVEQFDRSVSSAPSPAGQPNENTAATPVEPLEAARPTPKAAVRATGSCGQGEILTAQAEEHASPLDGTAAGGPALDSSGRTNTLAHAEGASPAVTASPHGVSGDSESQFLERGGRCSDTIEELCAQRDAAVDFQRRLSSELLSSEETVNRLTVELEKKNAFIDDLKTTLRSQENAFQEMLRTSEKLELVGNAKADLEKRVVLLEAEVRDLEELLNQKSVDHKQDLATKLAKLHETNKKEVDAIRNAFAQYVEKMTTYVDGLLKEHRSEAQRWSEKERLLKKQIERERKEALKLKEPLELQQRVRSTESSFLNGCCTTSPLRCDTDAMIFSFQTPFSPLKTSTLLTDPTLSTEKLAYDRIYKKIQRYLDKKS